jgi:NADPH:quinone reductase-like Zn-dependent oxidoreductase
MAKSWCAWQPLVWDLRDALIREHKSVVQSPLPLILGSDVSGVIDAVGPGVSAFQAGDDIYGVTNPDCCGAYTESAIASAAMVARKPPGFSHVGAASVPVVAVTAWQMPFDYAQANAGQTVLVHGGARNVGAYAVQLASHAGLQVFATASSADAPDVRSLGATTVIDYQTTRFEDVVPPIDMVLDTVGGDTRERSFGIIKPGGMLVSVVSEPMPERPQATGVRAVLFLVEVTTARLETIMDVCDRGTLTPRVGAVLPLAQARTAHEMLGGAPYRRGKMVLSVAGGSSRGGDERVKSSVGGLPGWSANTSRRHGKYKEESNDEGADRIVPGSGDRRGSRGQGDRADDA